MAKGEAEPTRREREEGVRRAHILDVTERLLAERGLAETSMADIAKEAEFGVGTLYKYFEDKNTLIGKLVEDRMGAHFDELEAALLADDQPERIVARAVGAYLTSVKARRRFFRFFMTNFHPGLSESRGPVALDFLDARRMRVIEHARAVFQRGIDAGRFAPVGAEALVGALFGMMMSFHFHGECQLEGGWDAEEFKEKILSIFFHPVLLVESRGEKS